MLNKRAIAILGAIFLLIVGTLGFLIYQRSSSNQAEETPVVDDTASNEIPEEIPAEVPTEETAPPDVLGGAVKLTDDQVISPALFFQGNGVTYFTSSGQLFQSDLQNSSGKWFLSNKRELTITPKAGIRRILWPDSGNNFIAESQSSSGNRLWSFYDSNKNAYVDLPNKITSLSWMPGGLKIAYIWLNNGKSTLYTANGDNTGFQKIADMWENDNEIYVSPNGQSILYHQRTGGESRNPIVMVTGDGKVFRSLIKDGYNYGVLWSPDSRKFLFGKKDLSSQQYQLWVSDASSGETKNLGVTAPPEKAVWSPDSQSVYVGAVGGSSGDKIVKLNIGSGESREYDAKAPVQVSNPFLNSGSSVLFFKNLLDGGLYYIDLNQ